MATEIEGFREEKYHPTPSRDTKKRSQRLIFCDSKTETTASLRKKKKKKKRKEKRKKKSKRTKKNIQKKEEK